MNGVREQKPKFGSCDPVPNTVRCAEPRELLETGTCETVCVRPFSLSRKVIPKAAASESACDTLFSLSCVCIV